MLFCKDFLNDLNSNREDLKIKGFLFSEESSVEDKNDLNTLFSKTIKLLLSIMESNNNKKVIEDIGECANFQYLINRLS